MTMIVEDGTGITGANSYATEAEADDYFDARANTTWSTSTADKEGALIRGTDAIDNIYRDRFPGWRTLGRDQNLDWPRYDPNAADGSTRITDASGEYIEIDEIPQELKNAVFEAALRELVPGTMMKDQGPAQKRVKAGSVEIEYQANAVYTKQFGIIDGIMAPLIGGGPGEVSIFGVAARG